MRREVFASSLGQRRCLPIMDWKGRGRKFQPPKLERIARRTLHVRVSNLRRRQKINLSGSPSSVGRSRPSLMPHPLRPRRPFRDRDK